MSSGRISSEVLLRAARIGVPVVASRTSPADMAIALAAELNVTVASEPGPSGRIMVPDAHPLTNHFLRRQIRPRRPPVLQEMI